MSLGAGPGNYDISFPVKASATFKIVDAANNPLLLPEDVSVLQGKIDLTQGNNREYVDEVLQNSIPKITAPGANPLFGTTLKNQVPFTEIGYGAQGTNVANAIYVPVPNSNGSRLFQNNLATAYLGTVTSPYLAANKLPYYEPLDTFKVLFPPAAAAGMAQGYGAALGGDSGGPLYTGGTLTDISITRMGKNLEIPIFTDSLSAIVVAGASPTIVNGLEYAVPIDQGVYNWLKAYQANPQSIPEPSSVVLLGIGVVGFLAWRCRHRAAPAIRNGLSSAALKVSRSCRL
jgi:PEP-CTERM motif